MAEGTVSAVASEVEYRDIEGFPGYRVGDDGSVWSRWKSLGRKHGIKGEWRRLYLALKKGYHHVVIFRNGDRHEIGVHRIVLEAFVGPCPPNLQACHNDGCSTNNHVTNLRWDTVVSNARDRIRHGTHLTGTQIHQAKLTDEIVLKMRIEYAAGGIRQKDIARKYGVCQTNASAVLTGSRWVHVGGPIKPRRPRRKVKSQ